MVGELIEQRKANSERRAVGSDQVDAGDLWLLAAVERKGRRREGSAGRNEEGAIALVEHIRLNAALTLLRFAALEAHTEHLHRVGERLLGHPGYFGVHRVAGCS